MKFQVDLSTSSLTVFMTCYNTLKRSLSFHRLISHLSADGPADTLLLPHYGVPPQADVSDREPAENRLPLPHVQQGRAHVCSQPQPGGQSAGEQMGFYTISAENFG